MPELPEVETTRRGIAPYIIDNVINNITVRNSRLRWIVDASITTLSQQRILSVQRRAKYLLLQLAEGWIIIHLGMSGRLSLLPTYCPPNKHDHIDMHFNNGLVLRYTDPRRFGAWLWVTQLSECLLIQNLGPEPLSENFSLAWFKKCAYSRNIAVKKWIMDNKVVVGVGNIYANEALFNAKIHPERLVKSLSCHELERLRSEIIGVLQQAIAQGGTTLRDFLGSDGKPGYFVQQLQVYGRLGKPCPVCSSLICSKIIGQRNSFYCEICQK